MEKNNIDLFEEEYIELWKIRELVFTLTPEMGWDAYSNLSSKIHTKINDYFEKIRSLEHQEKLEVYNKLTVTCAKIIAEENLFNRISSHFKDDTSGGRKFLLNISISTRTALTNEIKKIDYDLRKKDEHCNCQLKQEVGLKIQNQPSEQIEKIKDFTDGYYNYELHQCLDCNSFWINDLYSDDGPPKGWRKPSDDYELKLIEEH